MTISERISQSAFDGSRLRVILMLDLYEGAQQRFLDAYEHMRNQVASIPGHISDQLCQSIENPSQWLITSEWESAPPFLAWVNSEEHVETVKPMHDCVRDTRSMRYSILRETTRDRPRNQGPDGGRLQAAARVGDGVARHALTFTVKPGAESKVAEILAGCTSPIPKVDDTTRLRRTSLFMHGNRVVRAIEVEGDLNAALRHVARQPGIQAVEEAINPYLEQDRDLADPGSARLFFTRAALPAVHHVMAGKVDPSQVRRHALYYPAKEGCGMALARLLSQQDATASDDTRSLVRRSVVYQRDDIVVRLIDVSGSIDTDPAAALGVTGPRKAAALTRLLDGAELGVEGPLKSERDLNRLLAHAEMSLILDRQASES
ncbi:SchA/CurD-like domain-containing protein [Streptomyces sp. GC420]|uniref:SchA/CurD-like domain-containing protein n=1 Tax=Streptomyces sp. GC420 TaxID=2697568 RepID=UPI001414D37D|nr:SchA/CurD-like domain-containing protein [Streptomyces sp. GC420]NBM16266.1 TcmI family type II polyketide cyclase [Streptomyces sp. GC420]